METLERRLTLSAPTVADVNVSSTDWTSTFVDHLETESLGTDGYSVPVGSSSQLTSLSWTNLDQIRITFSEDVDVQQSDLSVSGVNTTAYSFSDFSYDSVNYVATWTLSSALACDKILIDLDGNGLDPVEDTSGNDLDGEWTDSSSTYNSGNGTAGGDFEFRFNVVPGDVSGDNGVNFLDAIWVNTKNGLSAGDSGYDIRYDVNGDGDIDSADYVATASRSGSVLPSGNPAGTSNDAPTTSGLADVNVNEDAVDQVLQLYNAFEDAEDDDDEMTYEVLSNSNSALFDSVSIDGYGGLTLDFADDAFGEAELIIRATDADGLFVDTALAVDVTAVNDAPVISGFGASKGLGDYWTFHGRVADMDDDVEGMIITLGGVLAGYNVTATVQSDGTFSLTDEFPGLEEGFAFAQTDDGDLDSNLAYYWVAA